MYISLLRSTPLKSETKVFFFSNKVMLMFTFSYHFVEEDYNATIDDLLTVLFSTNGL